MKSINLEAKKTISYKESYVAFLDVLGSKNMVFNKDTEKIENYLGIVNNIIEYLKNINVKMEIGSIIISDSIILSVPQGINKVENIKYLRHLCLAIALIQVGLALKNIWLRGAISSGDAYFDNKTKQVIGKAFIDAYILENTLAITPRVILDNKIIKELGFNNSSELIQEINKEKFSNWHKNILYEWPTYETFASADNRMFSINKDVPLFIDYLDFVLGKNATQNKDEIYKSIEKNMYERTDVYTKFKWVVNYYISKLTYTKENDFLIEKLKKL